MERRKFGNTGVEVSAISLGCWIFGVDWWGHYTDEDGIRLMKFAQDQGITFFDNGDAYGNGRAETMFGKFLKTTRRDRVEIGGKFGYDFYNDPGEVGSHKERKQLYCGSLPSHPARHRTGHQIHLVDHRGRSVGHSVLHRALYGAASEHGRMRSRRAGGPR